MRRCHPTADESTDLNLPVGQPSPESSWFLNFHELNPLNWRFIF